MTEGKKRKVHSADFKENSHQTIKKPYSLTPPHLCIEFWTSGDGFWRLAGVMLMRPIF